MAIRVTGIPEAKKAIEAYIEKNVQRLGTLVYQGVVNFNPVDTGYSRFNWHIDIGSLNLRVAGIRPESGSPPLPAPSGARFIAAWTLASGSIFIHNSVDYVAYLDAGSSPQARQGIVDPAVSAAVGQFRATA